MSLWSSGEITKEVALLVCQWYEPEIRVLLDRANYYRGRAGLPPWILMEVPRERRSKHKAGGQGESAGPGAGPVCGGEAAGRHNGAA